jgi:predicted  nucleic acid-binding Zn-ribbon protein
MSMRGEIENLQREIEQKKIELKSLQRRLKDLEKNTDDDRQLNFNMHLDPDKRNWEYDGYGRRVPK